MNIKEIYEKETSKHWSDNAMLLTEKGFCAGDYIFWLEQKAEEGERAIAAMEQIGELVYNCSCHADTSNAVTKIFMEYKKCDLLKSL